MNYTLKGSISRTQPYQLDPTLTLEGAGAEAKATGEAIKAVKDEANTHAGNTSNPHNVTKEQLGLENVDNVPDMEKPVSTAQAEAIADAKKAGTDAYTYAEEIMAIVTENKTSSDEVGGKADNAQTSADEAMAAAQKAQATADSKTAWFTEEVVLRQNMLPSSGASVTVTVNGVTNNPDQPIFILPYDSDMEEFDFCGIKPTYPRENGITFTCEKALSKDIGLRVVGFTVPAGEV